VSQFVAPGTLSFVRHWRDVLEPASSRVLPATCVTGCWMINHRNTCPAGAQDGIQAAAPEAARARSRRSGAEPRPAAGNKHQPRRGGSLISLNASE
jgi:hypothetical protein